MAKVLIIDDNREVNGLLCDLVSRSGHESGCAFTLHEGMAELFSNCYDVVYLDVVLPDGDGLESLARIREAPSAPEVIIITGFGDPDGAELAIKSGAWDYVQKPLSVSNLLLQLNRVCQYRENKHPPAKQTVSLRFDGVAGSSPLMRECMDRVAQAANSKADLLITGETGTGKELIAAAIHYNSPRADRSLVVVDCAALPETLVESALFGHERGAFTGADKSKEGLVQQADGGTLFLDEVGELPPSIQKSFLRVLQERRFRPIGSKHEVKSDFRLVAATNRNLDRMVQEGHFRKDLLFRIRSMAIELPSLRERREDISELILYYIEKLCRSYGLELKGYSPDFMETLAAYDWPGNIRELVGTMDSAIATAGHDPILFPKHLPVPIRVAVARSTVQKPEGAVEKDINQELASKPAVPLSKGNFPQYHALRTMVLNEASERYFQELMNLTKGDIRAACRLSGMGRTQLYLMIKKYSVRRHKRQAPAGEM
jgi:two-component system, NtrC family, response regulator